MKLPISFAIISAKISSFAMRLLGAGRGSTWPGEIALRLRRDFIRRVMARNPDLKTVFVLGTNGKTTTAKLLTHVLNKSRIKAFSNESGANLLNGIASALARRAGIFGKITEGAAIFEIDENLLPKAAEEISPNAVIALNLFRDQLDRYGEIDSIIARWKKVFSALSPATLLILNGQDPNLFALGEGLRGVSVRYFGLPEEMLSSKEVSLEADAVYCPRCSRKLHFSSLAYSHIGIFHCQNCGLSNARASEYLSADAGIPLLGLYNKYNANAAALAAKAVFGISPENFARLSRDFSPAFGRQERVDYQGRRFILQLSKNPVGFNRAIDLLDDGAIEAENVLLILNDNIPDGRDVSWIWDVEFERLMRKAEKIWVSGLRAYDLAVRLKYAARKNGGEGGWQSAEEKISVIENMEKILAEIIKRTEPGETVYAFPVYSAMLDLRRLLSGKAFE